MARVLGLARLRRTDNRPWEAMRNGIAHSAESRCHPRNVTRACAAAVWVLAKPQAAFMLLAWVAGVLGADPIRCNRPTLTGFRGATNLRRSERAGRAVCRVQTAGWRFPQAWAEHEAKPAFRRCGG